jgi:hypothetical protein
MLEPKRSSGVTSGTVAVFEQQFCDALPYRAEPNDTDVRFFHNLQTAIKS